jgi:hypothetical protein
MVITFPVGTYFESAGGRSDMVASRDGVILLTEDGPQSWSVMVRKAHRTLPVPEAGDRLEIRSADKHRATRNVTWLFQGTGLHPQIAPTVEQLALWIASENAGYDDLAEYASAAPIPTERTVALAAAYTASAGIDITLKQIWADREKFVPALTDENLRRFFEN